MAVVVNIVQPAIGTITILDSRLESYTVRYTPPAGTTVQTGPFRVYCEACGETLLQSSSNPATFNLSDLEEGGHPGPFDISLTTTQTGAMTFSAWAFPVAGGTCSVSPSSWSVPVGDKVVVNIRSAPNSGWNFVGLSYTVYNSAGEFVRERIHFSSSRNLNFTVTMVDGYQYVFEAEFAKPSSTTMWASIATGDGIIEPMAQEALWSDYWRYWDMTAAEGFWTAGMIKSATGNTLSYPYNSLDPVRVSVYKGNTGTNPWPDSQLGEYPGYFFRNGIDFKIVGSGKVDLLSPHDTIYDLEGNWQKHPGFPYEAYQGSIAFAAVAANGWKFSHFEAPGGQRYDEPRINVWYGQADDSGRSPKQRGYPDTFVIKTDRLISTQTHTYAIDPQKMMDHMGTWTAVFVLNPNGRLLYGADDHIIYGEAGEPLYSERTI